MAGVRPIPKLVVPARFSGRQALPRAPQELQDVLERYAREGGRTATFHFVPFGGWLARFSLRSNDPRMRLYQEGRASEPPTEDVYFHVKNPYENQVCDIRGTPIDREYPLIDAMCYGVMKQGTWLPLDIVRMGVGGVKEFLEMGNTWSGRGKFKSVGDALKAQAEHNAAVRKEIRERSKTDNRLRRREERRSRLKIPFIQAGIDLLKGKKGA